MLVRNILISAYKKVESKMIEKIYHENITQGKVFKSILVT